MAGLLRSLPSSLSGPLRGWLAVSLTLAAGGCSTEPDGITGVWTGLLTVVHEDRQQQLPVTLRFAESDHTLEGEMRASEGVEDGSALPGRRFEILEGLEAEGQVYFHARARMATGTASLRFRGAVETRDGDPHPGGEVLGGEVAIDVSTTEGELRMTGWLEARREGSRRAGSKGAGSMEETDR